MSVFRFVAVTAIALIVGVVAYNFGLSQGLAQVGATPPAPIGYYGYPYHWGFPFFGLLSMVLFLFLIAALVRAAIGGGWRGGGPHGWDGRRARLEELHRELHGEKPAAGGTSGSAT